MPLQVQATSEPNSYVTFSRPAPIVWALTYPDSFGPESGRLLSFVDIAFLHRAPNREGKPARFTKQPMRRRIPET